MDLVTNTLYRVSSSGILLGSVDLTSTLQPSASVAAVVDSTSGWLVVTSDKEAIALDAIGQVMGTTSVTWETSQVASLALVGSAGYAYLDTSSDQVVTLDTELIEVQRAAPPSVDVPFLAENLVNAGSPDEADNLSLVHDGSYRFIGANTSSLEIVLTSEILKGLDGSNGSTPRAFVAAISAPSIGIPNRSEKFIETGIGTGVFQSIVFEADLQFSAGLDQATLSLQAGGSILFTESYVRSASDPLIYVNAQGTSQFSLSSSSLSAIKNDGLRLSVQNQALANTLTLDLLETGLNTLGFTSQIKTVSMPADQSPSGGGGHRVTGLTPLTPQSVESFQAYIVQVEGIFEESSTTVVDDLDIRTYDGDRKAVRNTLDEKFYIRRSSKDEVDVFTLSPLNAYEEGN